MLTVSASAFADIQLHRKLRLFSAVKRSSEVSMKVGAIHSSATGNPASASRRKPMIRSSVKRCFMSNLLDSVSGL